MGREGSLSCFPGASCLCQPSLRGQASVLCFSPGPRSCRGLSQSRGANPLPALPDGLQQSWALVAAAGRWAPPLHPRSRSWRALWGGTGGALGSRIAAARQPWCLLTLNWHLDQR